MQYQSLSPLDDYPVHQIAEVMRHTGTSDRNFYDRYYFNCHTLGDDMFLVIGVGQYPNLGVADAFALLRRGTTHRVVRASRELGADRMDLSIGPFRVEVIEGLRRLRIVLDPDDRDLGFDLTWEGSIPATLEPRHYTRQHERVVFDNLRLAQTGRWSGHIRAGGETIDVTPDRWWGSRDRSWGVRPVGEPEPPGIRAGDPPRFYWIYAPMQFDDHAILTIVQEDMHGERILEEAVRVWSGSGERENLGRPEQHLTYAPGTRDVTAATIAFRPPRGEPFTVHVTPVLPAYLMVGTGYGLEPDWRHGMYQGPLKVEAECLDLNSDADRARMWGMIDAVARYDYDLDGRPRTGWGLFEYWMLGAHSPSGLTD